MHIIEYVVEYFPLTDVRDTMVQDIVVLFFGSEKTTKTFSWSFVLKGKRRHQGQMSGDDVMDGNILHLHLLHPKRYANTPLSISRQEGWNFFK
jgi:hypothetical protein